MKKTMRFILLLCFVALLVVSITACREEEAPSFQPENAVVLWEKIDATMHELKSMKMSGTTNVVYYYMGYRFEMSSTVHGLSGEDVHYLDSNATIVCDELSSEQSMHMVEAYYDGKMYSAMNDGVYDQKFCSVMTMEEYLEASKEVLSVDEIGLTNCTDMAFSNEDDSWNLIFSGYTKKTIDQVLDSLQLMDDMLGAPIADMQVKLVADAQFRVKRMEISFVFSGSGSEDEALPEFSTVTEYSAFNEAVFDPAELKPDSYTEVDDVRILDDISEGMRAKQDASSEQFTLDIITTYDMQGDKSVYHEKDVVEYGRKNGAYYYFIKADMEGQEFVIQYQNGEQKVVADGQTQSVSQGEDEAKAFIDSLIDSARYNGGAVSAIEKKENGEYILTIEKMDVAAYAPALEASGIQLESGSQQIVVAFSGDELVKIESAVAFKGKFDGEEVAIMMESTLIFEDTSKSIDR